MKSAYDLPELTELAQQVEELRYYSHNPKQRIRTGLPTIDSMIEGPAAGELFTIVGNSFSGKSLLGQNIIVNNRDVPSIFFSLEMPAMLAIQRMFAMWSGIAHSDVFRMTKEGSLPHLLDELANAFPWHVIVDKPNLHVKHMTSYLEAYEDKYGFRPSFVLIDYLEEVGGAKRSGEGHLATEAQASAIKAWAKEEEMAVFLIHQVNKSMPPWEAPNQYSPRGGGHTESDTVIGIAHPATNPDLSWTMAMDMENERRLNVIKNRILNKIHLPGQYVKYFIHPDNTFKESFALR